MLLCPSSFCFRIFFCTYQTYQTDWQRPFDPLTKTPTDSSIVYTWNWTCMTTDMTWNVSMPNCTDIKWYAFVLHIHARFYGVKLSSPRLSWIPMDFNWTFVLKSNQAVIEACTANGHWISCPFHFQKFSMQHFQDSKSRWRLSTSLHGPLEFGLPIGPWASYCCESGHHPIHIPVFRFWFSTRYWFLS